LSLKERKKGRQRRDWESKSIWDTINQKMKKPGSTYHDPNHHRSSTTTHKPFKGRHGHKSKSSLKTASKGIILLFNLILMFAGKVEKATVYKPKNHVPSKIERRNTQKQVQKNKKEEQVRNARFFGGSRGAQKIVVCTLSFDHCWDIGCSVTVSWHWSSQSNCWAEWKCRRRDTLV